MMNKKRIGILVLVLALVCALSFSLAFYTDRVEANGSMSTAEMDVDVTGPDTPVEPGIDDPTNPTDPTDPTFPTNDDNGTPDDPTDDKWTDPTPDDDSDDLENWWKVLNAVALKNFNPGDKLCLDAKITNNSTFDIEYRQTFIITTDRVMGAGPDGELGTADDTDPEFRLFTDCKRETYGALTGITVAPGENIDAGGKKITYVTVPADLAVDGSIPVNFDLVFDKLASNDTQGMKVAVHYILEATQNGADWDVITTATTVINGADYNVVPKA